MSVCPSVRLSVNIWLTFSFKFWNLLKFAIRPYRLQRFLVNLKRSRLVFGHLHFVYGPKGHSNVLGKIVIVCEAKAPQFRTKVVRVRI